MNVGQVEFSVLIDGYETTRAKVQELEGMANKLDGRTLKLKADAQIKELNKTLNNIAKQKAEYKLSFSKALNEASNLKRKLDKIAEDITRVQGLQKGGFSPLSSFSKDLSNVKKAGDMISQIYLKGEKAQKAYAKDPSKYIRENFTHMPKQKQIINAYKEHGKVLNSLTDKQRKYVDTAKSALPVMVEHARSYAKQLKKVSKAADWDEYNKTIAAFENASGAFNAQKRILQGLSQEGAARIKQDNEAAKAASKAAKQEQIDAERAYRKGLFSHIPETIKGFSALQREIRGLGTSDAITRTNEQMDLLRSKLNSVSMARAKFAQEDTAEAKAKRAYLGTLGQQYAAQYRWYKDLNKELTSGQRMFEDRERQIAQFGSRMQTLGGVMQRVTSPFMNVFRGAAMGLGYRALGRVTESISGAFSRYDTMRTYSKVLSQMGINMKKTFSVGGKEATNALDNLDQAVRGLPTGLDEIVGAMRRYAGATGEVERSTKLAIAANNAFIAGQMDDRQKLFTERQLLSLAGGAELASTQWDSLRRNAPMAFRSVAKELKMSVKDMSKSLKEGKTSGQEFLDAFISVGTEGKIAASAQKMKMTWNAVSQNITNAFNRMGEGILKTMDNVFKKTTGRDFLQNVLGVNKKGEAVGGGIKDFIDGISESIQNFIKNNPEKITKFFEDLKSIDWKGMLQGYAEVGRNLAGFFTGLAKTFGGRNLIHAAAIMNIVGRITSAIGGFTRGLAGPLAKASLGMKLFAGGGFFSKMIKTLSSIGRAGGALKGAEALSKTGEAVQSATISWQGVANKAVNIVSIPAIARSLYLAAKALQEFSKVKLNVSTVASIGVMGLALKALEGVVVQAGSLISASKTAMIGTGVASLALLSIGGTILMVGKGVKAAVEAFDLIGKAKMPKPEKIGAVVSTIKDLTDAMRGDWLEQLLDTINPLRGLSKISDAIATTIKFSGFKKAVEAIESIDKLSKVKIENGKIKSAKQAIRGVYKFMGDVKTIMDEEDAKAEGTVKSQGANWRGNTNKVSNWSRSITEFSNTVGALTEGLRGMSGLIEVSKQFEKDYAGLFKISKSGRGNAFSWSSLRRSVSSLAKGLYGLTQKGEGEDFSPMEMLKKVGTSLKGTDFSKVTGLFNEIPAMMKSMRQAANLLNKSPFLQQETTLNEKGQAVNKSGFDRLAEDMKVMFESVSQIMEYIPDDMGAFQQDAHAAVLAFTSVKHMIQQLQKIASGDLTEGKPLNVDKINGLGEKIGSVISNLKGQLTGASTFQSDAHLFSAGLTSVKNAISKLGKLEFSGEQAAKLESAVKRIKTAIKQVEDIKVEPITKKLKITLTATVNAEKAYAEITAGLLGARLIAVMKIASTVIDGNIKVNIGASVTDNATAAVASKIAAIRAALGRDEWINKTIHVNVTTSTKGGGKLPVGGLPNPNVPNYGVLSHTGGYIANARKPIYRSSGGIIAMKPKGKDIIPAMLAKGEYVVRKRAVDKLGAPFMQKLNHLDIVGALNTLSIKAGRAALPTKSTIINNKTINHTNKPNITINNPVGNGGVGLVQASRWAHSF